MRKHPAWLAAGLLFFAVLACNIGKNNNANNSNNNNSNTPSEAGSGSGAAIKDMYMAKDDGNGKPGDHTSSFEPGDHTIHCVATLKDSKAGTDMKFSWWIVEAEDGTKNQKIKDIDYSTKPLENVIHGHLTLPRDWPKGRYKVQVYVNGDLDKTVNYSVE